MQRFSDSRKPGRAIGMLACLGLACALAIRPATASDVDDLPALERKFAAALDDLAQQATAAGLSREAETTRAWLLPRDPMKLYLVDLPGVMDAPSDEHATLDPAWRAKFRALRNHRAAELFELARRAVRQKQLPLAYDLAIAALREDPDLIEARRLLGYQQLEGRWCTPFEARKLRGGQQWHPSFGWIASKDVKRYEAGQRPSSKGWITAEDDAARRDTIDRGWDIETEHFHVITNHSLEEGVRLSAELERFYRLWQQAFATYGVSPEQLARAFEGRAAAARVRPKHLVVYFRNREEYLAALTPKFGPGIEITTGTYLGGNRRAYFYHNEDRDYSVLHHEITHQLFSESRVSHVQIGAGANFWIIEGIACYMESLAEQSGFVTLGGADTIRLAAARHRRLVDEYVVPFAELVTFGMERLQQDPQLPRLYSQAAGMTHFLMHAGDGRYRPALLAYLEAVYGRTDSPTTLAELTGRTYSDLDTEYREFLETLPETPGRPTS